ncbi:hypothetical protein K504DRAFT_453101 [Pleomassaria siparia CBS 279.74]|uniref:Uncharacterized protein n=1 Tax=Pleomassaria siparia CBS 279.74 TaxID=1314801 RepID=A0A6G1JQ21_9PLEO|nr:hypothetical protein K504DRAFT_453101 [Pleomassaria siparia CBS 279.74]
MFLLQGMSSKDMAFFDSSKGDGEARLEETGHIFGSAASLTSNKKKYTSTLAKERFITSKTLQQSLAPRSPTYNPTDDDFINNDNFVNNSNSASVPPPPTAIIQEQGLSRKRAKKNLTKEERKRSYSERSKKGAKTRRRKRQAKQAGKQPSSAVANADQTIPNTPAKTITNIPNFTITKGELETEVTRNDNDTEGTDSTPDKF